MNSLKPLLSSADQWPLLAKPAKWLRRRLFAVSEQQVYDAVFSEEFARLQERFAEEDPEAGKTRLRDPRKYVIELRRLLQQNLRLVDHLGLYGRPPMDILDLGCGPGYFMKICEMLGHRVSGLDIDTSEMFRELIRLQKLRRFIIRIEAFTPCRRSRPPPSISSPRSPSASTTMIPSGSGHPKNGRFSSMTSGGFSSQAAGCIS